MASDSGDDAAALRERVAQLEQTVAEQQQPSESTSKPTASRRGLLKGAAAVAGLGALGVYSSYPARAQAAGQVGTSAEPVDVEAWSLNVQNALAGDLDGGGNSLTNIGSVETDGINNGSVVRMTPTDDFQTRVDAVPEGGTLLLEPNAVYDVATTGTAHVRKPMEIRMSGGGKPVNDADAGYFDNTGSDTVDDPVITIDYPNADDTGRQYGSRIVRPAIRHEGATTPAIDVRNPYVRIEQPIISLNRTGSGGIHLNDTEAFGVSVVNGVTYGPVDYGIRKSDTGGRNMIFGHSVIGSVTGTTGYKIDGGEMFLFGCAGSAGTVVDHNYGKCQLFGCRFENFEIGAYTSSSGFYADSCKFANAGDTSFVLDANTGAHVHNPLKLSAGSSGDDFRFGSNSVRNQVSLAWDRRNVSYTDNGFDNSISIVGLPVSGAVARDNTSNPHQGMMFYNKDSGTIEFHDGTGWQQVNTTAV